MKGWKKTEMKRSAKGQVAVIIALVISVLIACIGLGADMSIMYYNHLRLQKAADASALAGAGYLVQVSVPPPSACSGGGLDGFVCAYVSANGVLPSEIVAINHPADNPPAGLPVSAQTVEVKLHRTARYFFLQLLGLSNYTVAASAVAVSKVPVGGVNGNLFPVGMDFNPGNAKLNYKDTLTLTNNYQPGNWGWINIPLDGFQGSSDPSSAKNLSKGGANTLGTNIQNGSNANVNVGDWLSTKTGQDWGPVNSSVASRGIVNGTALPSTLKGNEPNLVTVPLVSWAGVNGGTDPIQIKAFAEVWIVGIGKQGSSQQLTVQFVQWLDDHGTTPGTVDMGSYLEPYLVS
jgi:hypothetical protein